VTSDSQDSPQPRLWGSHHLPPYSILCTSLRGPHLNSFLSRDSRREVLNLPILGLLQFYGSRTLCANLQSQRGLKQSCYSRQEISNGVLHTTYTQGSRVDFRLFVVESQTVSLILSLSFYHNLCFRCPNGSCKPILDIYISITFQWYKELFNAMCFDLYNCSLKAWESTGTPTPKMGAHLGVGMFIFPLSHAPIWLALLQDLALVANPKLKLRHLNITIGASSISFIKFR